MTASQRSGAFAGKYTDDQEGVFTYTCPQPAAAATDAAAESASALAASVVGVLSLAALDL